MTTLSSCSKDSEDLIVGEWIEYKKVFDNYPTEEIEYSFIYKFYEDGTCEAMGLLGTWSITEDTLFCDLLGWENNIILELTSSDMVLHTDEYGWEKCYASYFRRR